MFCPWPYWLRMTTRGPLGEMQRPSGTICELMKPDAYRTIVLHIAYGDKTTRSPMTIRATGPHYIALRFPKKLATGELLTRIKPSGNQRHHTSPEGRHYRLIRRRPPRRGDRLPDVSP